MQLDRQLEYLFTLSLPISSINWQSLSKFLEKSSPLEWGNCKALWVLSSCQPLYRNYHLLTKQNYLYYFSVVVGNLLLETTQIQLKFLGLHSFYPIQDIERTLNSQAVGRYSSFAFILCDGLSKILHQGLQKTQQENECSEKLFFFTISHRCQRDFEHQ